MDKLKACPFCANNNFSRNEYGPAKGSIYADGHPSSCYVVICSRCWARGPAAETEAGAITCWNNHGNEPAIDIESFLKKKRKNPITIGPEQRTAEMVYDSREKTP